MTAAPIKSVLRVHQSVSKKFILADVDRMALAIRPPQNVHDFGNLLALFTFVAAGYCVFDAVAHVIPEDFLFGAAERGTHGGNLGDNVDAVAVFFDHADDAADLALNAVQSFQDR